MHSAPEIGIWSRVRKKDRPTGSKKFHYSWNFDDGETGFVVHKKIKKDIKCFTMPMATELEIRTIF